MKSLSAVYRTVRFILGITDGDGRVRKTRGGTSRDRVEHSVRSIAHTLPRGKHDVKIKCVFCYFVRTVPEPAITVMNGQAVCEDHTYYAQGGEFTKILTMVKRDEQRD